MDSVTRKREMLPFDDKADAVCPSEDIKLMSFSLGDFGNVKIKFTKIIPPADGLIEQSNDELHNDADVFCFSTVTT
jgi:hypothetical protein